MKRPISAKFRVTRGLFLSLGKTGYKIDADLLESSDILTTEQHVSIALKGEGHRSP